MDLFLLAMGLAVLPFVAVAGAAIGVGHRFFDEPRPTRATVELRVPDLTGVAPKAEPVRLKTKA